MSKGSKETDEKRSGAFERSREKDKERGKEGIDLIAAKVIKSVSSHLEVFQSGILEE